MLNRLKKYIDYKGISISAFERSIGMSNASFGKSLKNGGSIGGDKLEKILSVYPDINAEWLLTGAGEMLKSTTKMNISHIDNEWILKRFEEIVAENALLKRENEELKLSRGNVINTPAYPVTSEKIGTHMAADPGTSKHTR